MGAGLTHRPHKTKMPTQKLLELTNDGGFRSKVAAVLETLSKKGYPDVYIVEAKRTLAQQQEKVRRGYSKTLNSYHLKRGSDTGGLAADIVPKSKGWNAEKRFWLMLGWLCYSHGLGWGGLFGLSATRKNLVLASMKRLSKAGWPAKSADYETQIGWDGAHVQKKVNW